VSTLRDAHVSHNSIPGPQGVQSSGETAPVMGRSLITTRASPLIGPRYILFFISLTCADDSHHVNLM
jgi:hypothetical protein